MRHGSLCTGYGGLDMAAQAVFGGELAWWSDVAPDPMAIMEYRYPGVPNLGDVKVVDWTTTPRVDVLTAGYPCQPFSNVGSKRGTEDARHIWPWIAVGIEQLRPKVVVLENVSAHLRRGFHEVIADLATLGFDAEWVVVRASDVGAVHERARLFVVAIDAHSPSVIGNPRGYADREHDPAYAPGAGLPVGVPGQYVEWGRFTERVTTWSRIIGRRAPRPVLDDGHANPEFTEWAMGLPEGWVTSVPGVSRAKKVQALGNGVVPQQAEHAIRGLLGRLTC